MKTISKNINRILLATNWTKPGMNFNFTNKSKNLKGISNFIYYNKRNFTTSQPSNSCNSPSPSSCTQSQNQVEEISKILKLETKDYFIHQFEIPCLSQYSYYIESNGEAAIIDPMRETDMYIEMLSKRGAKLKYILETHFHADFVSGHLELARSTNAKIIFGPGANTNLDVKIANDNELLPLGGVNIKVFHTPGHTLESSSYVLLDKEKNPKAIFTGDFLFLGEVGRPDLAVEKNKITSNDLAGMLFDSIQRLKKEYPGELVIFPGHGAGSACGKNILKGSADTLRNQIKFNYALNENLSRQDFINVVTANLPTPPDYFFYNVSLNKKGYENLEDSIKNFLKPLKANEFMKIVKNDKNVIVIDSREFSESRKCFLLGSCLISLSMPFAVWVAKLFKPDQKFLLIADKNKERETMIRLSRVGYENVLGFLDEGVEDLKNEGGRLEHLNSVGLDDLKFTVDEDYLKNKKFEAVDCREPNEWESTGILPDAHLITLTEFKENNLKNLDKEKAFGVYCRTGARATIGASVMKKFGFNNVFVLGGVQQMMEKNVKLMPKAKH